MNHLRDAALSDRDLIDVMMQDYLLELSTYTSAIKVVDGRYHYPYLAHYWQDPDRHPYLIGTGESWREKNVAGFLLVREDLCPINGDHLTEVAEAFIKKQYRRKGLAEASVLEAISGSPGIWRVCVLPDNKPAYGFWRQLIEKVDPHFEEETPSAKNNHQVVFKLLAR